MTTYLIWSHRHNQWWGPDRAGYTSHVEKAGRYTKDEAADITIGSCLPGANIAVNSTMAANQLAGSEDEVVKELEILRRI